MIKALKKERQLPSLDFIAGVISIEGTFMWIKQNKKVIPVFQLKMRADEQKLFELIKFFGSFTILHREYVEFAIIMFKKQVVY